MAQEQTERRLILFGRYPVPGQTKTRLLPALGPLGAAELQRQLTERTLTTLTRSYQAPVTFVYDGGSPAQIKAWLTDYRVSHQPQVDGDLGHKMARAIQTAMAKGAKQVVLVGTDVPELTTDHVARAFAALADHDVVLGPSNDGGYWLVGCRKSAPIFDGITWGRSDVLSRTIAKASGQGLSTVLLSPLDDIDTPGDLDRWAGGKSFRRPYLSVILPTLNEAGNIDGALAFNRGPDMEAIVCDGGSSDNTPTRAQRNGARVISTPKGRAIQQNAGAHAARGRVLLFLHADTRLPDDFGNQVFERLMDPRVVLGAFRFRTDLTRPGMRWIERIANLRSAVLKMPYGDQALFLKKRTFHRIGGFPVVPIAEDLFMVRRLNRLGRVAMAPGAAVTSGRRWRKLGIWHTTIINSMIAAGCLVGIAPERLAPLYAMGLKKQ